ncbi:hypothetical protein Wcon_00784 [Wolbachia endosymbiont of Cylisticus convexus]|nr:hypothetical protein Wcon_00784 [Wolbachia endosymbiont of Cylisticus convexus]
MSKVVHKNPFTNLANSLIIILKLYYLTSQSVQIKTTRRLVFGVLFLHYVHAMSLKISGFFPIQAETGCLRHHPMSNFKIKNRITSYYGDSLSFSSAGKFLKHLQLRLIAFKSS